MEEKNFILPCFQSYFVITHVFGKGTRIHRQLTTGVTEKGSPPDLSSLLKNARQKQHISGKVLI